MHGFAQWFDPKCETETCAIWEKGKLIKTL
jgi:hypothetical protein